jgi:type I restriction enzyme S subunit
VVHILTSKIYRDLIRKVCVGGIDKRQLNKNHIEEFPIIYPDLENQQIFAEKIESIEKQKELINKSIVDVQQLFDHTMDKYFN